MNVNELLDTIQDLLEEGSTVPFAHGKRLVDVEQIEEYLDELRSNLPRELNQSQNIVNERVQIIDTANAQAKEIVRKAEERAKILLNQSEIVKNAEQRAAEILDEAEKEKKALGLATRAYCDDTLKKAAELLQNSADEIKALRDQLKPEK